MRVSSRKAAVAATVVVVAGALGLWALGGGGAADVAPPPLSPSGSPSAASTAPAEVAPRPYSTDIEVGDRTVVPDATLDTADSHGALESGHLTTITTTALLEPTSTQVVALTQDGTPVVAVSRVTDTEVIGQVVVGTLAPDGEVRAFSPAASNAIDHDRPRQGEAYTASLSHAAWVETTSTDLQFDNWAVFTADLGIGHTVPLGSSQDVLPGDDLPVIGPYMYVTLGSDAAYWGTPVPQGAKGADGHYSDFELAIVSRALDGSGRLETVAERALLPAADGSCVFFARVHGSDPTIPLGEYTIDQKCDGVAEVELARGQLGGQGSLSRVAASGSVVAWSLWDTDGTAATSSDIIILDTETSRTVAVHLSPEAGMLPEIVNALGVDSGLVQWASQSARGLVDVVSRSVWTLPPAGAYWTILQNSGWIGWQTIADDGGVGASRGRWTR